MTELTPNEKWKIRAFDRNRDEARFWRQQVTQLNVRIAELEADAAWARERDRTDVAWLQAKVVAQARELRRINDQYNADLIRNGLPAAGDVTVESLTIDSVRAKHAEQDPR